MEMRTSFSSRCRRGAAFCSFLAKDLWITATRHRDTLPPLTASSAAPASNSSAPLIFTGGDSHYFMKYGLFLANSSLQNVPHAQVHFHIIDPTPAAIKHLDQFAKLWPHRFSFSTEWAPERYKEDGKQRLFFLQSIRFVHIARLLDRRQLIFAIDMDSIIRHDPFIEINREHWIDVGLYFRHEERDPGKKILASTVVIAPTKAGKAFATNVAARIAGHLYYATPTEKLDQLCLFAAYRKMRHDALFWNVPQSLSDWTLKAQSPVWTAKGKTKHLIAFANEQNQYPQATTDIPAKLPLTGPALG